MFISDVHPAPPPQEEKEQEFMMIGRSYAPLDLVFSPIQKNQIFALEDVGFPLRSPESLV